MDDKRYCVLNCSHPQPLLSLSSSPPMPGSLCVPVTVSTIKPKVEVQEFKGEAEIIRFPPSRVLSDSLLQDEAINRASSKNATDWRLLLFRHKYLISHISFFFFFQTQSCPACSTQRKNRSHASSGRRRGKMFPSSTLMVISEVRKEPDSFWSLPATNWAFASISLIKWGEKPGFKESGVILVPLIVSRPKKS